MIFLLKNQHNLCEIISLEKMGHFIFGFQQAPCN